MPLETGGYHYVAGPVVAVVIVCLLAVLARWIFGTGRTHAAGRALLSDAGIRSTLGVRRDGSVQVLVFPDDEDRARRLVPPAV